MDKKIETYTRKQIRDALRQIFKNRNEKAYFIGMLLNPKFIEWDIIIYPFDKPKRECKITFFDKPVVDNSHQMIRILDSVTGDIPHNCNAEVIIHAANFKEPIPDPKGVG